MLVYHKGDAKVDQLIDGKRNRKMTGKGRQYRLAVLEKRQVKLVARTIRKSSETDDLMYSPQNSITVKEELAQQNEMIRMLVEIHEK